MKSSPLIDRLTVDGDKDRRLEVGPWSLDVVAYAVAVLLRREPGCHPFTSIDAQSVSLNTLRAFVFALTPAIRYLKAFLEELVGLRLSRESIARLAARALKAAQSSKTLVLIGAWLLALRRKPRSAGPNAEITR